MYVLQSKQEQVTLGFGQTSLNGKPYNHAGIDLVKKYNQLDNVIAGVKGKVIGIQKGITGFVNGSYGNYVKLQHNDGYETIYGHLKTVNFNMGDIVQEGQIIGYMGATGMAYGAHLHFEVRKNGIAINPAPFLQGQEVPAYQEEILPVTGNYKVNVQVGMKVRTGPGTNYKAKNLNELSVDAQRQGGYKNGVVFTVSEVRRSEDGQTKYWGKTPSGWVCLDWSIKV